MAFQDSGDFGFEYLPPKKQRRNWAKSLLLLTAAILLASALLFALAFDRTPMIEQVAPPNADDVLRAKNIYRRVILFTAPTSPSGSFELTEQELNSLFIVGSHARPNVLARAMATEDALTIQGSVRVPFVPGLKWMNISATLDETDHGLEVSGLRLGSIPIPAPLALWAGRKLMDRFLQDNLGTQLFDSIGTVRIGGGAVKIETGLASSERNKIAKRAKIAARGFNDLSTTEAVHDYIIALDDAVKSGRLQPAESIAPFLAHTVRNVADKIAAGSTRNEAQAALLALAVYCGNQRFEDFVGDALPPDLQDKPNGCVGARLNERIDLRLHLVVSAGLQTLSNSGAAFAVGEIKELLDSNKGGSGFSFDDLAADRAGIRFATRLLEATPEELSALASMAEDESDFFPSIEALPTGMAREDFERIYKDVESAAYEQLVAEIDRRLDGVRFFRRQH